MSSRTRPVAVFLLAGALIASSLGGADKKKPDAPTVREEARVTVVEVPVNVIDKPKFCDFSFGAIVNRSPLVIGISTDGAAPVFAMPLVATPARNKSE